MMELLDCFSSGLFNVIGQTTAIDAATVQECLSSTFKADSVALNCGSTLSKYVAQSWDLNWQNKIAIASPEFIATMNLSRYIAGPAVALWAINGLKQLYRNGLSESWGQFATIFFLVVVLYGNNAYLVRQTTLAARQLINYQNNAVLLLANSGENIEAKLSEISDYAAVEAEIIEYRSQCNGITRNEELITCLQGAEVRAEAAIERFLSGRGESRFSLRLKNYVRDFFSDPLRVAATASVPATAIVGVVANSAISLATEGILVAMNGIVQNLIELSWLFTAVIVPIPLALSFYPGGRSALVGWAVGFLTLGLFKINLNLATALVVSMIYSRGPGDAVIDLTLLSIGVVIMALGMTAGGGLAIFNGITTVIAGVTLGLVNISAGSARSI